MTTCFHCGEDCVDENIHYDDRDFCCHGCKTVYTLLSDTGLVNYYEIDKDSPGATMRRDKANRDFLDLDEVKHRLIDFREGNNNKVTFYLPTVHCSACIWLLEKLDSFNPGVTRSEVNFLRKELTVHFNAERLSLKELVMLLEDLGYPPDLQRDESTRGSDKERRKLLLKLGIAGFAFGNIMLFSFPEYLSMDHASLGVFKDLFSYLNLMLALPVLLYADADYLKSAWQGLRLRYLSIDVPIAIGIITLFSRSAFEVLSGTGTGYFDSFAGLVFFLLVGKWYQSKTYDALAFDRDFKSYFPIAVTRIRGEKEEVCMLENIRQGDRLRLMNNQVIPADAVLLNGTASIDYSFVSGESVAVEKRKGDLLYAGGKQTGDAIEVEVVKEVSQSYLTGLWNQSAYTKEERRRGFSTLVDQVSRSFSIAILSIALITLAYWLWFDPSEAIDAFTAVLIIACPCALALSMPFAAGNVSRILGKLGMFVKNTATLEQMADVNEIVFDKTGTLTKARSASLTFVGDPLSEAEKFAVRSLAANSIHPLSVAIRSALPGSTGKVNACKEELGSGMHGVVKGHRLFIGAAKKSTPSTDEQSTHSTTTESAVHVYIDEVHRGYFQVQKELRAGMPELVNELQQRSKTHLLSGDHEGEKERMEQLFGKQSALRFRKSPMEKLAYVEALQTQGTTVMMLGDGLNDAGALKRADVGIAVADDVFGFSPACDAILQANKLQYLGKYLAYIRKSLGVVRMSIVLSLLYNLVGLFFAVRGELTPLVAAILMPLSSVSVVVFVSLATNILRPKS
ncbi:MAG: heavy metal translocating P-type ATPase metal-binding domain-containing protein [Cryomorphaceae bacterium]